MNIFNNVRRIGFIRMNQKKNKRSDATCKGLSNDVESFRLLIREKETTRKGKRSKKSSNEISLEDNGKSRKMDNYTSVDMLELPMWQRLSSGFIGNTNMQNHSTQWYRLHVQL